MRIENSYDIPFGIRVIYVIARAIWNGKRLPLEKVYRQTFAMSIAKLMYSRLKIATSDLPNCLCNRLFLEVMVGFQRMIRVLQTLALPFGDIATGQIRRDSPRVGKLIQEITARLR